MKRIILAAVLVLCLLSTGMSFAGDGTTGKPDVVQFSLYKQDGSVRQPDLSKFSVKAKKNGTPTAIAPIFSNDTTSCRFTWTPPSPGNWTGTIFYNNTAIEAWKTSVRDADIDTFETAHTAQLAKLDQTISSRATATDASAIKAKTDNLPTSPAAVGSAMTLTSAYDSAKTAAPASTALSNATWTNARAAKLDFLDAAISSVLSAISAVSSTLSGVVTTLSTLVMDTAAAVWSAVTRELTGIGGAGIASESNATANKSAVLAEVDTRLTSTETKMDVVFNEMTAVGNKMDRVYHNMTTFAGTGDTSVTHDFGGSCNLCWKTASGSGISDGLIVAYTKADWAAGNRTDAYQRGWTKTGDGGQWLWPLWLNHGVTYTLVYSKSGMKTATVEVTP